MNSIRKLLAGATLAVVAASVLAGCSTSSGSSGAAPSAAGGIAVPAKVKQAGTVDIAVYLAYPPYSYVDSSGRQVGFELDMARAVARKLGVTPQFHSIEFPALIPSIANRRYDWALGTMFDLPERRNIVDFLDWARADMFVQVHAGNPDKIDPANLCGVSFGHVQGSAQVQVVEAIAAECAKSGKPAPTQMLFQDVGTQLQALRNHRFQADLQDPAAGAQTERQTNGALVLLPDRVPNVPVLPSGWVFAKGNTEMEKAVVQAVGSLIADGTWQKLMNDNGMTKVAIVPPTINTKPPAF
ncbi:transporter substrate-binding domain-containing protein [Amycolatopsis rubida]|uniref:Transporter substrate-binding domain-containing protein n=1 Tax=Amycolatopsis rubida TaxID=112413 RepID=A0ABX0C830_9PSEU|nr:MULTISPECIES: transporter substrate-binding domain-containing protein [Amycolatopsis]MYW96175.1 transporter substrate-binding domain-containing protein [Amycolatopsis rubida]NEC61166.1 transporter substrate-binding domain-containing protein [Amycolatopsis rubida]OAP24309.1 Cystine-binding periplasmic protein precursor [Amycolatopsis sp. M39]